MISRLRELLLLLTLGLGACQTGPVSSVPTVNKPVAEVVPAVGDVPLQVVSPLSPVLDMAVVVFDQGVGESEDAQRVFPTVRKAESLLMPVTLARTLEASGAFPLVRVVHDGRITLPLVLTGEIIRADGAELELRLELRAADGDVLLNRRYRDVAQPSDYPVAEGEEPFADLYRAASNDVLRAVNALSVSRREHLQRLALLDFGAQMAPGTFSRFVEAGVDGRRQVVSYPAEGDPMLSRLQRIRRQDDLFIDTVDEQYSDLYDRVVLSYGLWREYSFELQRYGEDYREQAQERKRTARRGTFGAMQQVYASYRKVKIQEEDLRDLVAGFAGESLETVLEVDDGVIRLQGSVDERYAQWRSIMERIYGLESAVPDAAR